MADLERGNHNDKNKLSYGEPRGKGTLYYRVDLVFNQKGYQVDGYVLLRKL
jgi:hypothetical protein